MQSKIVDFSKTECKTKIIEYFEKYRQNNVTIKDISGDQISFITNFRPRRIWISGYEDNSIKAQIIDGVIDFQGNGKTKIRVKFDLEFIFKIGLILTIILLGLGLVGIIWVELLLGIMVCCLGPIILIGGIIVYKWEEKAFAKIIFKYFEDNGKFRNN